jgi:antitoxin ParD1/3/4
MAQSNVALPADLQRYVDARVAAEGFADSADFLRDLVRRDQDEYEADVRRVQALLKEGRKSGIVDAEPEDILDEIIAEIHCADG